MKKVLSEALIQAATDRGYVDVVSSAEKAIADRLVRENRLELVGPTNKGGNRYRLAPPPKTKKKVRCGGCGRTFLAWTAGACGKCKKT